MSQADAGYFHCGLPFNRLGHGPRPLVVFQGLMFENRPQPRMMLSMYDGLGENYTVYAALRKPGLRPGCTLTDMANDYAQLVREEFGAPVDVMGTSTGGSIVQIFAADHPDLVRRLVIHSSAYTLSPSARAMQMQIRTHALAGRWREAFAVGMGPLLFPEGAPRIVAGPAVWLLSTASALAAPANPSDLAVTIEAEDTFDFRDRLHEISAPTLVIAGDRDPFYTPDLFRETAAGIPGARLILYPGMGHPASGKQFARDVLAFLGDD